MTLIYLVMPSASFRCFRKDNNGNTQEVEVEILDAGPDDPELRYHCTAKSEDGKTATGNPASIIPRAFAYVPT